MNSQLYLYFKNILVGILKEDEQERLSFKYAQSWLESDYSFSISVAMQIREEEFGHIQTKAFFENLLPEGEVRKSIEALSKNNVSDEFSFLKEYGLDCAGAFILSPKKLTREVGLIEGFDKKEVELATIYNYLRDKRPLTSAIINEEGARFSLAGAQDKFPVIYKNEKLYIPLHGEATTHILKPYVRYHQGTEDTPFNEHFCMELAQSIGLNVPDSFVIKGEFPLYLVERFDREATGNIISRLHQEDFCQAQGLTSRKKYEDQGGPSLGQNYQVIKDYSSMPLKDLSQFLKWFWFNLFIGNNDCHSKNLSLLHTGDGIRLSPFYDLLCTSIYKGLTSKFSYRIGGQYYWFKLKLIHFKKLSDDLGISEKLLLKEGRIVAKLLEETLAGAVQGFNSKFPDIKTGEKVEKEVLKRIAHFKHSLVL